MKTLQKIKDRINNATAGPWFRIPEYTNKFNPELEWEQWITADKNAKSGGDYDSLLCTIENLNNQDKENAELIANAPTDLALLIEAVELSREALQYYGYDKYHNEFNQTPARKALTRLDELLGGGS